MGLLVFILIDNVSKIEVLLMEKCGVGGVIIIIYSLCVGDGGMFMLIFIIVFGII